LCHGGHWHDHPLWAEPEEFPPEEAGVMKDIVQKNSALAQNFPWFVLGVAALFLIWNAIPPASDKKFTEFASLPVVDRGRIKPWDTFARTNLMIISGKQTYKDDQGQRHSAVKWMLDVISGSPEATKSKVFRIDNLQVLAFLGLPLRPGSFRYSIEEFRDKMEEIIQEKKRIDALDQKKLSLYEHGIVELMEHLGLYLNLATGKAPMARPPLRGHHPDDWKPLAVCPDEDKVAYAMKLMFNAYADGDQEHFASMAEAFHKALNKEMPQTMEAARFEVFFNYFAPFYKCTELYVFVFLFACLAWLLGGGEGAHILAK